ncbi:hypothetical protein NEAUS04_0426 [Nematocida ausubeli]|uniref:Sm domain-containing protein n=1 Tax=Nematocida ausubeli (strain ATCC PRA-371 / ERTm2) TaxID=1913371 RepID=A0A086J1H5_NEMA1|nr:uncharacterized protein NESG_01105 [Nematocida ausubeli]KAI5132497.1 hypothetical protein NEAUS07_0159 [Nematocida ausubeli]KAI5135091.1 hypothetical protein NEAUS06_1373 [Nematocida ausubeli]KAI5147035.1 hypothetical protein NEAUS05_0366 [Nematocida ausubeli]KAI5159490.1 hypothetical protein NEAUS03_0337 [Nematocida ausubeli]KAI5161312.1 hypothetical protein NEAUS04_0426 [Nematocida ausubeli]
MYPLDFIRGLLGTKICITMRDSTEYRGVLRMFDEHINLIISNIADAPKEVLFLRSENVLSICEG